MGEQAQGPLPTCTFCEQMDELNPFTQDKKRRKKIADYLGFRNADIVMVRQDFKPWVWIVKNDVMAKILSGVKNVYCSPTHENGE